MHLLLLDTTSQATDQLKKAKTAVMARRITNSTKRSFSGLSAFHGLCDKIIDNQPAHDYLENRLYRLAGHMAPLEEKQFPKDSFCKNILRKEQLEHVYAEMGDLWNPDEPKAFTISNMCFILTKTKKRILSVEGHQAVKRKSYACDLAESFRDSPPPAAIRSTRSTRSTRKSSDKSENSRYSPSDENDWDEHDDTPDEDDCIVVKSRPVAVVDATQRNRWIQPETIESFAAAAAMVHSRSFMEESPQGHLVRVNPPRVENEVYAKRGLCVMRFRSSFRDVEQSCCMLQFLEDPQATSMLGRLRTWLRNCAKIDFEVDHVLLQPQVQREGYLSLYAQIRDDEDLLTALREQSTNDQAKKYMLLFCTSEGQFR